MTETEFKSLERGDKVKFIGSPVALSQLVIDPYSRRQAISLFGGKKYVFYSSYNYGNTYSVRFYRQSSFEVSTTRLGELAQFFEIVERRHAKLESNKDQRWVVNNLKLFREELVQLIGRHKRSMEVLLGRIPTEDLIPFTNQLDPDSKKTAQFLNNFTNIDNIIKDSDPE